jgi:hypothetical protein
MRDGRSIRILSSLLRVGNERSQIDNHFQCGIDSHGNLGRYAIDINLNCFEKHPFTGVQFKGIKIPEFEKMKNMVKDLHQGLFYFKFASWDMTVDQKDHPIMIEVNLRGQGILYHQLCNGPLLGSFTEAVFKETMAKSDHYYHL